MLKIPNDDFLALTLSNEGTLQPFSFLLKNGIQTAVWDTGVIVFTPPDIEPDDYDIVLSCGIHGNETAPIELLNELIAMVLQENLCVKHRVLFLIANPMAINVGKRFIDENMNRLFSGGFAGSGHHSKEYERAKKLEMYVSSFYAEGAFLGKHKRIHYDLHTSIRQSVYEKFAVYPYLLNRSRSEKQFEFLAHSEIPAVLLYHKPAKTFSFFSSGNFYAHALTLELGKVHPFGQNDLENIAGVKQALQALITGKDVVAPRSISSINAFKVSRAIIRRHQDFYFTFPDDAKNFTAFPAGTILGYDGGIPFTTETEGEVIIFPLTTVKIGQRALLIAQPYAGELI